MNKEIAEFEPNEKAQETNLRVKTWRADNQLEGYTQDLVDELRLGLTAKEKFIPAAFLYDDRGSVIGDEIVDAESYYLGRLERFLLDTHCEDIAKLANGPIVVELGSGSGKKNARLLQAIQARFGELLYMPNDINEKLMVEGAGNLVEQIPGLDVHCLAGTFEQGVDKAMSLASGPKLFMLLGSTISQLDDFELLRFWKQRAGPEDQFLIAFDLLKDRQTIVNAYSNQETARHSANALASLNRSFDGDFDEGSFEFDVGFNEDKSRNETFQRSKKDQTISLKKLGLSVSLKEGERIRTAYQRKFDLDETEERLSAIGLDIQKAFLVRDKWYSLLLLGVAGR